MKKILPRILLSLLLITLFLPAYAKKDQKKKQEKVINDFIADYNARKYGKLKKHLFFLGKVVIRKKMMKEIFAGIYEAYGDFRFCHIRHISDRRVEMDFSPERDITLRETMIFNFNKRNKLNGFTLKQASYSYPVNDSLYAEPITPSKKAVAIYNLLKNHYGGTFNGCVLVIDSGQVISKGCFGYANFEHVSVPLTDTTVFYLASVSKQFTSMAIMMLAEQGKLKYTDSIRKYIPELPEKYQGITIEHLLTHTSGFSDYMELFEKHWDKKKTANNQDVVQMFCKYEPKGNFKPGERFSYSNTGYVMLAVIIERASGKSFHDYLGQHIFSALGMKHTEVMGVYKGEKHFRNFAQGRVYSDSLKQYVPALSVPANSYAIYLDDIEGDGNVNSCISDMVLWDDALRAHKLIRKSSLDTAYSNHKIGEGRKTSYGYGVFVADKKDTHKAIYHSGGWPGYHIFTLRFPDMEDALVILTNNEYIGLNQLADRLARILINRKFPNEN